MSHVVATWKDTATRRMLVSTAVLLPGSASGIKGKLRVVVDDSETIDVKLKWPSALNFFTKLHQRGLVDSAGIDCIYRQYTRVFAFELAIDSLRQKK